MDVRCERCGAQYALEESRITEAGVSVRCSSCGNVFVVRKKAVVVTEPLPASNPSPRKESARFEDFSFPKASDKASDAGPAPRFESAGLGGLRERAAEPAFTRDRPSIGPESMESTAAALKANPNRGLPMVLLLALLGGVSYLAYRYFVWVPQRQRQEQLVASKRSLARPAPPALPKPDEPAHKAAAPPKAPSPTAFTEPSPKVPSSTKPRESAPPKLPSPPASAESAPPKLPSPMASAESAPRKAPGPMQSFESTASKTGDGPPTRGSAPTAQANKPDANVPARSGAAAEVRDPPPHGPKAEEGANFDSYMDQADRLREREQPRAALQAYQKAQELEPARPEPLAGRGLALLDLGRTSPAIAAFQQALQIDPRHGIALMGLAEAYRAEGKKEQAVRYYEKYLAVAPDGPEALVAKAAIKALQE